MTNERADDSRSESEPLVRTEYSSDAPPSEAIVRALAAASGAEPTDLEPLYDSIETDALDALLGDPVFGDGASLVVEFVTSGYRVVVRGDGHVSVLDGIDA